VFTGKKRMGQRGRRERVSLYFSTSCLFSCVRIDCQRWYEIHVGGLFNLVWVRVAYLVWKFGLRGLWVTGYSCCENVHAGRHCDHGDARLAVRIFTTDGAPADCVELNHQNQGGLESQCSPLPREEACKRARSRAFCDIFLVFFLI